MFFVACRPALQAVDWQWILILKTTSGWFEPSRNTLFKMTFWINTSVAIETWNNGFRRFPFFEWLLELHLVLQSWRTRDHLRDILVLLLLSCWLLPCLVFLSGSSSLPVLIDPDLLSTQFSPNPILRLQFHFSLPRSPSLSFVITVLRTSIFSSSVSDPLNHKNHKKIQSVNGWLLWHKKPNNQFLKFDQFN